MLVGLVQSGRAVAQSFGQLFQTVQRDRAPPPTLLKQVCARGIVVEVVQLVHREGLLSPALVDLGSGRTATSEIEAPNMLGNLV